MRSKYWSPAVWLAIACLCCVPTSARGQTISSASVTGTVRDSSGSLVPGATIDIRNHATNQLSSAVTDAAGA